jgi:hypothetical protein
LNGDGYLAEPMLFGMQSQIFQALKSGAMDGANGVPALLLAYNHGLSQFA